MKIENSSDAILDMIEQVYEFDDVDELLPWFFTALNSLLPLQAASYMPFKPSTYIFQQEGAIGLNFSKDDISRFFKKHMSNVPLFSVPATIKTMAPNKGIRVNKMLPDKLYRQMPIYTDCFEPMGIYYVMPSLLVANNAALGGLALHRCEKSPFSKEDKAIYDRIAPHLARAIFFCSISGQQQQVSLDEELKLFRLSKRQKDVTRQLLQGLSNREIAVQLSITEQTVRDHLYAVYQKMSVKSRTQLISLLSRNRE